jgi:hypothetical protein
MHERWSEPMPDHNETERTNHEITWVGRLDGGIEYPNTWRGKFSAKLSVVKERFGLNSEQAAKEKLDELKEKVGSFYVVAGLSAVVRCIDGRGEDGPLPDNKNLGTQVPGGTPVTSIGYRFAKGWTEECDIVTDFAEYRSLVESLGLPYISGAHQDEHNVDHPEHTGCGAIDKMLEIIDVMRETDENGTHLVYEYAKVIASKYMDEGAFDKAFNMVQGNLDTLDKISDRYFRKGQFRTKLVDEVKEGGEQIGEKTVETSAGEHRELLLVINHVEGQTFDRDGFAASNEGLAQAFNYDAWAVPQRARDIFTDDSDKQNIMMVTNFMYAVATAMVLTDGSLELGIRE